MLSDLTETTRLCSPFGVLRWMPCKRLGTYRNMAAKLTLAIFIVSFRDRLHSNTHTPLSNQSHMKLTYYDTGYR